MLGDCGSPQDFVIYKRERFGSDELHYTRSPDFVTDVICKVGSRTNSNEVVRAIPYPLILDFDVTKDYCDHNDTTVMVQMCAGDDMVDASIGWSDILPYIEEYQDHIDSMTVEIIGGPSWARLEDNSPQLITQRYNDQRLTLSNDGDSSIEDFRRAILGTEISGFDGPFNGTIEVQFQLFSYIRRSLPASLFIDISTEIIEAGRDTSVTFCPLDVPQDLNNYLSAEAQMGQWVQGPIYDPQQDDPGEYDYVVRGNFCPEDTVHITVQLYPEATVDRQVFSLCPGDSILYAGQYYDEETTLLDTIYAIETGCDSLYNTVEIIELNQALIIESDTLLCNGEVLMISGQDISTPGIYSDTIRNNSGCDSLITQVTLSFAPQVQEVFIDTTICSGSNIIVGERIIDVGITDIFSVAGASGCDSITYNINVLVNEVEEIMIDTVLCLGESIEIQDEVYNETTDESIVLTDVNGCDSLIYILRIVEDIEQFLYQEYEVTTDEPTVISIDYNGSYNSILWIPQDGLSCVDCLEPELKITEDKIYNVEIENTIGCIDIIEVAVFAMEVTQPPQNAFYLPNVISTSDSGNDKFFLQSAASKSMTYSMSIYDRWGSEVFRVEDIQSNDATAGWDGISYNGAELLQGVYVYKIVLEDGSIVSGDILVLR
jgi:gliding motility-associated-like protein